MHIASRGASRLFVATMSARPPTFVVDPFCERQFNDPNYTGTKLGCEQSAFEKVVNDAHDAGDAPLVDGYAPFCKHVFIRNFTPATLPYLAITDQNQHLLRSAYEARTEQELPVLVRWFPREAIPEPPVAAALDVILYSREQIRKEAAAMGRTDEQTAPWGIISVKAQDEFFELPMNPITVMRNALGAEHGGSGVPLDAAAYKTSVDFWSKHAVIR